MSDDKHLTIFDYAERTLLEIANGVNSWCVISWLLIARGATGSIEFSEYGEPKIAAGRQRPKPLPPLTHLSISLVVSVVLLLLGHWHLRIQLITVWIGAARFDHEPAHLMILLICGFVATFYMTMAALFDCGKSGAEHWGPTARAVIGGSAFIVLLLWVLSIWMNFSARSRLSQWVALAVCIGGLPLLGYLAKQAGGDNERYKCRAVVAYALGAALLVVGVSTFFAYQVSLRGLFVVLGIGLANGLLYRVLRSVANWPNVLIAQAGALLVGLGLGSFFALMWPDSTTSSSSSSCVPARFEVSVDADNVSIRSISTGSTSTPKP